MIDNLASLIAFVRLADTRSFKTAANQLGMSGPAVSKAIAKLEGQLGVKLFHRTTRSVSLSNDGQTFLERCRRILDDIKEAEELVTRGRLTLRGRLRVQMPLGFGRHVVLPAMQRFLLEQPDLKIDVDLSDRVVDFSDEGLDLAVRIGEVPDSRVIAKKIYDMRFITCASPEYLQRYGTPRKPEDLVRHQCLTYWMPQLGRHREWHFARRGVKFSLPVSGDFNVNNSEALVDAAIAGRGIVSVATFLAAEAIKSGALKVVLLNFATPGPPISAVYWPNRHLSARVRVFLDFLMTVVPAKAPWDVAVLGR